MPLRPQSVDRLIDAGVNCLHPLQARAANMSAETLAREFRGRIAFLGGIDTQDLLIHALIFTVIKKCIEPFDRREAEMVTAMGTDLHRIDQLAFVKRVFAFRTFYKDAFGPYDAFLVGHDLFYLWLISFEPRHMKS